MLSPISLRFEQKTSPKKKTKLKINPKNIFSISSSNNLIPKNNDNKSSFISFTKNNQKEKIIKIKNLIDEEITTENSNFIENEKLNSNRSNSFFKTNNGYLRHSQPKIIFNEYKKYNSRNKISFSKPDNFSTSKKIIFNRIDDDKKIRLSDINSLKEYFFKKKLSNSIYSILNRQTKEFINNMNNNINYQIKKKIKKIPFGLSPFPNIRMKKKFKIPESINKSVTLYNKNFEKQAIGERYEKNMKELLKLKQLMNNIKIMNKENKNDYAYRILISYLSQNGINDKKYFSKNYLKNFKEFLKLDFAIDPKIAFKECLLDILNGKYDKYIENPMDSIEHSLHFIPKQHILSQKNLNKVNLFNNHFKLQKKIVEKPSIIEIQDSDVKSYMESLQSCTNLSFEKLENYEIIKKKGKLLEFICYNKQKKRNLLNNCLKRVEKFESNIKQLKNV